MDDLLLGRRRMMLTACGEPIPADVTAWANSGAGTIVVSNGIFTIKYTSSGKGVYRTISLTNPITITAGDSIQLDLVDGTAHIKAKSSVFSEKSFTQSVNITASSSGTISQIQMATTVASGTEITTRIRLTVNGVILIGNSY